MGWNLTELNDIAQDFNEKYFKNSLKMPINVKYSRRMFNSSKSVQYDNNVMIDEGRMAVTYTENGQHYIELNVSVFSIPYEQLKTLLAHEMIHAWQQEHVKLDFKGVDNPQDVWHGPSFMKWANKLNKLDFEYPINRYYSIEQMLTDHAEHNGGYFIYKMVSNDDNSLTWPLGVFVKFLYNDEVQRLKRNGLKVRMFDNIKMTNNELLNSDYITYNFLKNLTIDTFIPALYKAEKKSKLYNDDDFNFNDGDDL